MNRKERNEKPHPLQERLGTIFSLHLLTKSSFLYVIKQWFSAPAFGTVRTRQGPGDADLRSQVSLVRREAHSLVVCKAPQVFSDVWLPLK